MNRNASERLGVTPSQVVDYLALVGDSSDNIPGVKGVGEKGAQKLLAEYGNLDTILSRAGEVTAKRTREALLAGSDNARLSRELVTIRRDVPVELDLDMMKVGEPDFETLRRILTELEFFSLAKKLQGQGTAPAAGAPTTESGLEEVETTDSALEQSAAVPVVSPVPAAVAVTVIDDPADLPALVDRLRKAPIVGARHRDFLEGASRCRPRGPRARREPRGGLVRPVLASAPSERRARPLRCRGIAAGCEESACAD